MIHDLFLRRYSHQLFWGDDVAQNLHPLLVQITQIIFDDLQSLQLDQGFFQKAHNILVRELGIGRLGHGSNWDEICGRYLVEPYDLWNDRHGAPDWFLKGRLSLVELIYREAEVRAKEARFSRAGAIEAVETGIREMNSRMRQMRSGLHYHNGLLQLAHDPLSQQETHEPCWEVLRADQWRNVDRELKIAMDQRDQHRSDASFQAAKALESTIKVISDHKGWTTGRERGAAQYIDNLISQTNGRFLEPWEGEMLKLFFGQVRNPQGHGAGSASPAVLSAAQTDWAIEFVMAWIKNLVRRT